MDSNGYRELPLPIVDEYTNRFLAAYPVHCGLRTVSPDQRHLHSHKGYELYLCLQGKGSYLVGDRLYPLHGGTLTVIRPQVIHRPVPDNREELHRYVLSLDESYLAMVSEACPELRGGVGALLTPADTDSGHWFLAQAQLIRLRSLMGELEGLLKQRPAWFELLVLKVMAELLYEVSALCSAPAAEPLVRTENERLIGEVLSYLVAHHQEDVQIEDLLRQFPVSRSRLLSLFKLTTGNTIKQFLTEYRVHQAKMLLADTVLPVTEVAARTGFGDLSHFFGVFKQQTGQTPKQYRREHQGGGGA